MRKGRRAPCFEKMCEVDSHSALIRLVRFDSPCSAVCAAIDCERAAMVDLGKPLQSDGAAVVGTRGVGVRFSARGFGAVPFH